MKFRLYTDEATPTVDGAVLRLFTTEKRKLVPLSFLLEYCKVVGYTSLLSLGAGTCAFEYLIQEALPGSVVVGLDKDGQLIANARAKFPTVTGVQMDFTSEDLSEFITESRNGFELAYFMDSSYVMDNVEFIETFRRLKEAGIGKVVDITSAWVPLWRIPQAMANHGQYFHGYGRTIRDLRHLYRSAGWTIRREGILGDYWTTILQGGW